ncbi:MAG: trehalose-6-phosphate synthase [Alphaproteobacteria bacterium]|nr:trehalose-6-phosphate synthase [Alphaproteobacteria bacterium]
MARVFIISNRVAVPDPERGVHAGGLEVALKSTLKRHECVWLGWSGEVKPAGQTQTKTITTGGVTYIVTDLSEEDYEEYYNGFANRVLWPILHYRLDLAEFTRRDLSGYLRVNEHFAAELDKVLEPDDIVWVHDYHLVPLAKELRQRGRHNRIGFFLHIPMPPAEILTAMPNHEKLVPALLHYDLVGFQTDGDAQNFARYLATECGMPAHIPRRIGVHDRTMRIGTFPVGIETREFTRRAERAARSSFVREVRDSVAGALMLGVDRLDYSKGITLRLDAYERFLVANPNWHGEVTYAQITPRSRSSIHEYAQMEHEIDTAAGHINGTYGDLSWTPLRYTNKPYTRTALAGLYRAARVGIVTPLRDGMNLVAKEYVAAQDPANPGVLILSRFAGAAAEFGDALIVNPYDPEAVGSAIRRALEMPLDERIQRHGNLYRALLDSDIRFWGDRFLSSLTGYDMTSAALPASRPKAVVTPTTAPPSMRPATPTEPVAPALR